MRELLEKWAALEPERCHEVEYGDGTAIAVVVEGETLYADSPGRVKFDQAMNRAVILAATIEAIEARDCEAKEHNATEGHAYLEREWGWRLIRMHERCVGHVWRGWPGTVGGIYDASADSPAEALLTAYLAALEAA